MLVKIKEKLVKKLSKDLLNKSYLIKQLKEYKSYKILNNELYSMILGVLRVQEMRVRDIMIPRSEMVIIEKDSHIENFLPMIIKSTHSRFPVILDNKDEVIGILLAKDILPYANNTDDFKIDDILRPAVIIPESKRLNVLLKEFKTGRNHLAIVVDEYGRVSGLVTIEDVLEQIVGDITDEHDFKKDNITTVENNKYMCKASTPIEEFDAKFDTKLNNRNYDTIGGFVIKKLNKLPKNGENLVYGDMRFTVKDTSNRKINRILVEIVKT